MITSCLSTNSNKHAQNSHNAILSLQSSSWFDTNNWNSSFHWEFQIQCIAYNGMQSFESFIQRHFEPHWKMAMCSYLFALYCDEYIISISNTVICQTMHQIFLLGFAYDTDVNGDRGKWQNNRFIFHEMDYAHIEHEREETSESCGQRDGFSIAKAKPWITLTLCMVSDMMISRHLSTSL